MQLIVMVGAWRSCAFPSMPISIVPDDPEDEVDNHVVKRRKVSQSSFVSNRSRWEQSLGSQQEQDGRCGECDLVRKQTARYELLYGCWHMAPLTIVNEVYRGCCLVCKPFPLRRLASHQAHGRISHRDKSENGGATSCDEYQPLTTPSIILYQHPMTGSPSLIVAASLRKLLKDDDSWKALDVIDSWDSTILDILVAMNTVPDDALVQQRGCERIWILSWEEENADSIGRAGGIFVILRAMSRFRSHATLQHAACESLQNLASNDFNVQEICDQSGVDLVVSAMTFHSSNAAILKSGCSTLAAMASSTASATLARSVIERAGGVAAILTALWNLPRDAMVVHAAHDALSALGYEQCGRVTPTNVTGCKDGEISYPMSVNV